MTYVAVPLSDPWKMHYFWRICHTFPAALYEKSEHHHDVWPSQFFSWYLKVLLQFLRLHHLTYAYWCCKYILVEMLQNQLLVYTWIQARNRVRSQGSFSFSLWSCSSCTHCLPGTAAYQDGLEDPRAWDICRTGSFGLTHCKILYIKLNAGWTHYHLHFVWSILWFECRA